MPRRKAEEKRSETDDALAQERAAEDRELGNDPNRDASLSDDEQAQARDTEARRAENRDPDGNDAQRVDAPAERGASEDDGGEEDRPDNDTVRSRIAEGLGMSVDELDERFAAERGLNPGEPAYSHVQAFESGYAGSTPDPLPNEAYTVSGQVTGEAAAQDRRAASRGRLDDVEAVREQARSSRVGDDE